MSTAEAYEAHTTIKALREELEALKLNEKDAREQVVRLQDMTRRQRLLHKMREVVANERHERKIDHLKQQLTENSCLWDQLAESENREKILRREIEKTHQEISSQDKVIERLKDELKNDQKEKQKLLQYKTTKSKRLEELEGKAREFEVLAGVDLAKMLGMLERQDRTIDALKASGTNLTGRLQ